MFVKTLELLVILLVPTIGYSEIQSQAEIERLFKETRLIFEPIRNGTAVVARPQIDRSSTSNQEKDPRPSLTNKVEIDQLFNTQSVNHSQDEDVNKGSTYGYPNTSIEHLVNSVEDEHKIEMKSPISCFETSERFSMGTVFILTVSICLALCLIILLSIYHRNERVDQNSLTSVDTSTTIWSTVNESSVEFSHPSLTSDSCPTYNQLFSRGSLPTYIEATSAINIDLISNYTSETNASSFPNNE